MPRSPLRLAFCMTGSFCTFEAAFKQMERCVSLGYEVLPVLSFNAAQLDTRFGRAAAHLARARAISGHEPILTIQDAEPLGPKNMTDLLLVCPCTGNTLAKLAAGIADTCVTFACKAHLRNGRPIVLAVSTNDGLAAAARNIGDLLNRKHYFFVPFGQDDPRKKPMSLIADLTKLPDTVNAALQGVQLQPLLL